MTRTIRRGEFARGDFLAVSFGPSLLSIIVIRREVEVLLGIYTVTFLAKTIIRIVFL